MAETARERGLNRSTRVLGACGSLAAAFYIAADVVGVMSTPGYSAISDAISELVESGAAAKPKVDRLLLAYHGLVIPFAFALARWLGGSGTSAGPFFVGAAGLAGVVLTVFFPCDPGCEPFVSLTGTLHIFIAIPMGFAILAGLVLIGLGLRNRLPRYSVYTLLTAASGLVLAVTTVALAETQFVGLFERLLTASYLQWYAITGVWLASGRAPRLKAQPAPSQGRRTP